MDKKLLEKGIENAHWKIKKYDKNGELYEESEIEGNALLDEGANLLTELIGSTGGTEWNSSNAYLGVGDSSASTETDMTGLQGSSTYKGMEDGYPTYGTDQKITWKASFASDEANHDWQEFTVSNDSTDNDGTNLNRTTSDEGTKSEGQTWELELEITFS
ncbi:MAG: hypothetical protein ACOCTT_02870 [archaeon]